MVHTHGYRKTSKHTCTHVSENNFREPGMQFVKTKDNHYVIRSVLIPILCFTGANANLFECIGL